VSPLGNLLAQSGEDRDAKHLAGRGYTILECNYPAPLGELDLISLGGHTLVFVKVKARTKNAYGAPELAATGRSRNA
jgi:putative endonuclease